MSFFISNALADTATSATTSGAAGGNLASILLLVGFVVIFYLMLWRPQAKRAKAQRDLINSIAKGDEVVTNSGIMGKITDMRDDVISLQVAENVEIKMQKVAVGTVLPKGSLKNI